MEDPALSSNDILPSGEHHNHTDSASIEDGQTARLPEQHGMPSERQSTEFTLEKGDAQIDDDQHVPYNPNEHGFRRIIRNFTPSWFIITMGTGILSVLLYRLPYTGLWLRLISEIFFVLNLVLFIMFFFISCLRYYLYPQIWKIMIVHPHQSLFLGAFPVSLATLINMVVFVCVPAWGHHWITLTWALWWIDCVIAVTVCFHMTFVIMSNRRGKLEHMTALWLIPVVSVVIVAASGSIVASVLPNTQHKLWTLIISYVLWGIGMPLSWIILTIYFLRLTVHEPLTREIIVSAMLPMGPLSLGSFSIITLGKQAKVIFPLTEALALVGNAGETFYVVGFLMGLILWGFALVWFVIAVVMIVLTKRFPFNMGWWGFIFPTAIFALATTTIGNELKSRFFKVLGTVMAALVVLLWIIVAIGTIQKSITGAMFYAPCLGTDLKAKLKERKTASGQGADKAV